MRSPLEIMEKINFEKIHAYMILTKWTYGAESRSPSISKLTLTAKRLLDEIYGLAFDYNTDYHYSRNGGFKAHYCPYDKELHLEFMIEYW